MSDRAPEMALFLSGVAGVCLPRRQWVRSIGSNARFAVVGAGALFLEENTGG